MITYNSNLSSYLTANTKMRLTSTEASALGAPITLVELNAALKSTKPGRSPGPDGLPIEYYKQFRSSLLPHLLSTLSSLSEGASFHPNTTAATITVIPKPNKDHTQCSNYRPISLLNSDIKLLARVLADRLSLLMPRLVHADQVGFIPGREARDATTRVFSAIRLAQVRQTPMLLLSMDADKAFDRVSWRFLFSTLEHLGVGDGFMKWVTALYDTPTARVRVNGALSDSFNICNGTRQGCPLSPLLFALFLEPLLTSVRANATITGIDGQHHTHKLSAYADDLMFMVTKPSITIPEISTQLTRFGSLSGFHVNTDKSEILNITLTNLQCTQIRDLTPYRWCDGKLKYLGVWLANTP
uniref:Reverse transcriptase domain-containing protein n=1 Tax=Leptobrachium leishanense TaxID=445787 RepID=A0A8C5MJN7_9ANUR